MPKNHLNLNIETEVLTLGHLAEIVNSILEFLLFRRNQIPFVYPTYRYYVGSWSEFNDNEDKKPNLQTYQLERQRELAKETRNNISDMRETIRKCFQNKLIKTIRFLFGSSSFTPKESYTIHIPVKSINTKHLHDNHPLRRDRLNQILIFLLTNEELFGVFKNDLNITNIFLQIETVGETDEILQVLHEVKLFQKDLTKIPSNCKDVHFHLLHYIPDTFVKDSLKCCADLEIYQDSLSNEDQTKECVINEENCNVNQNSFWWESPMKIRGFKEKILKGKSIWTS